MEGLSILLSHTTTAEPEQLSQYSDEATGWTTGFRFPPRAGILSLRHHVQTDAEDHQASYPLTSIQSQG
jgi:hypothetical protein